MCAWANVPRCAAIKKELTRANGAGFHAGASLFSLFTRAQRVFTRSAGAEKLSVSIRCAINAPAIFHLSLLHGVQRNP